MATMPSSMARDVRLIALLRGISLLGDTFAVFAMTLRFAHSGTHWAVGALLFANAAPPVLLSPVAGLFIDRFPARRTLTVVGVLQALCVLGLLVTHNVVLDLAIFVLLGCGVAFTQPGYGALVPSIVDAEHMAQAQGLLQTVAGVAGIAGPATAGLVVAAFGYNTPFLLDAVSFAVAAGLTMMLHGDRRPDYDKHAPKEKGASSAGLRWLFRDDLLRPVVIQTVTFVVAISLINVAEVFMITKTLHASPAVYGYVGAMYGVGNILGAVIGGKLPSGDLNMARFLFLGATLIGASFAIVGWVPNVWWVFPLMTLGGIGNGVANVAAMTLFNVRTPHELQGRVFAAIGAVFTGASLLSMAVASVVVSNVTPRTIFRYSGVASVAAVVIFGPLALRQARRAHEATQGA